MQGCHENYFYLPGKLMKQLFTISLLLLIIALQYSRTLAFIQCKAAGTTNSTSFKCACEHQSQEHRKGEPLSASSKQLHFFADDLYTITEISTCTILTKVWKRGWQCLHMFLLNDHYSRLLRPPCTL